MKYAYHLEISAIPGDEHYELFEKHAKMLIIKEKESWGLEHAQADICYRTAQSQQVFIERRFKYIPEWFSFLSKTVFYSTTIINGSWEIK